MAYKTQAQWKADLDLNIDANGVQAITGTILNGNQTDQGDSIYWGQKRQARRISILSVQITFITFDDPMLNEFYQLQIRCYDSNGNNIDYQITNELATGFSIQPATDGFVDYFASI